MNLYMKRLAIFFAMVVLAACSSKKEEAPVSDVEEAPTVLLEKNIPIAIEHYKNMMETLEGEEFPKTYVDGEFKTSNSGWWCSGFYPGTLLYLFQESGDSTLLTEAERMLKLLEIEQYNKYTHDLGFMMYCSFGNALKIAPKEEYKRILVNSAESLSSRFSEEVGAIKSWDSLPEDYLVIIDNMMNLELLFWATRETGDSTFYDIAVTHANTTLENHFREDNSSYHVVNYDPNGGGIQEKKTAQGLSDSSAWARGQAWGLYGFTVMFRETRDSVYLDQADKIAQFFVNHPNLPKDKIPLWDFDAKADEERDASAAAIAASGLLELDEYHPDRGYAKIAKEMLAVLSGYYTAEVGTNGNFLIMHNVGHKPENSEVDVPLTYADYYFIEGLIRLSNK
ncbi:glycoside hydrolase family 88 protein [Reichenbachiella ulvae]|uniref:Glycoside hydrolase family 88 protein n=1 Tax=Reichenbachiella ulvae TaxID=2980104 RepID=A0ABT3CT80_9BACT|nr:glycoside hydrolase family 88 protein [Reichenbachiella ulvae]MCV9386834.1 glycoside hydrolase family 88 protein [Reichenbachiella ulvae]